MSEHEIGRYADNPWHDEELLRELYVEKGLSTHEVADHFDTSGSTIYKWLNKYNIGTRGQSEAQSKPFVDEGKLRELYVERGLSIRRIEGELDCSSAHIQRSLEHHGIERRENDHAIVGAGEENPNWKGGHHNYYGINWHEQRRKCLKRDDHKCRSCGLSREKHKEQFGRDLEVHHVVPLREFDEPENGNSLGNLVTACVPCHRRYEGLPVFPE